MVNYSAQAVSDTVKLELGLLNIDDSLTTPVLTHEAQARLHHCEKFFFVTIYQTKYCSSFFLRNNRKKLVRF